MIIEHFILARDSSVDIDSNALSIFHFIEEVRVQGAPKDAEVPIGLQAIIILRRESEQGERKESILLEANSPTGKQLFKRDFEVKFNGEHRRARLRVNFVIPATDAGYYRFEVSHGGMTGSRREMFVQVFR